MKSTVSAVASLSWPSKKSQNEVKGWEERGRGSGHRDNRASVANPLFFPTLICFPWFLPDPSSAGSLLSFLFFYFFLFSFVCPTNAMLQGQSRDLVKRLLVLSRAKLVASLLALWAALGIESLTRILQFNRITKTRYTRFYFILSAFTCLILCALQAVILSDNTKAVEILTAVVDEAESPAHITILKDGELYVCDSVPDRQGSNCIVLWVSGDDSTNGGSSLVKRVRAALPTCRHQTNPSLVEGA